MSLIKEIFNYITNETLEDYQERIEKLPNPEEQYQIDMQLGYQLYLADMYNHSDT